MDESSLKIFIDTASLNDLKEVNEMGIPCGGPGPAIFIIQSGRPMRHF